MALTKQQKLDMIYDLELRLAKEELVEQHVKNMAAIESSEKPMQTAKNIIGGNPPPLIEVNMPAKENALAGRALHQHQRDQWHNLSERQFEELKSLPENSDIEAFADKKQSELETLLKQQRQDIDRVEKSEQPLETEQAILHSYDNALAPEIMANMKQKFYRQSSEEKELLEQSEIATKTPFKKDGLDSKTQWEFSGLETQAMRKNVTEEQQVDFNLQEHFDNAQSMFSDHGMEMER
ncbi:MAG: hypothetical protein COB36_11175 [Alphaproteobacteria bacterium]|nr:MAG: hypothetical protein COB36_11175 [Alphaproteobacteria bacterium]